VTTVIDKRITTAPVTRILITQIQTIPTNTQNVVFVVIEETRVITIVKNLPTKVGTATLATATATPVPVIGTWTPGGAATVQSGISLLPIGQTTTPVFSNAQVVIDPAKIILADQKLIVANPTLTTDTEFVLIVI